MDPLRICIALGPIAAYLIAVALVNRSRRPVPVTGARDTAALALGISGLVIIGPIELFLPEAAAVRFEPNPWIVWALLLSLYFFSVIFWILVERPRLVIYNIPVAQLRPVIEDVARRLDPDTRWAGDNLLMPASGLELRVDYFGPMRNTTILIQRETYPIRAWRDLTDLLAAELARVEVRPNPTSLSFGLVGLILAGFVASRLIDDAPAIAQSFAEMFFLR